MDFAIEFDYDAEAADELSVKKGDIVINAKQFEDGWMIGTLKGKKGVFPSNFGKPIAAENNKHQDTKSDDSAVSNDNEVDLPKETTHEEPKLQTKKVTGVGFGNIFSGKQIQLKHTVISETKSMQPEEDTKVERFGGGFVSKAELVKAIYSYKAENSDELHIEEGDIITIIDKKSTDEGWWKGKLNGKIGVFPNNFVVPHGVDEVDRSAPQSTKPNIDQSSKPVKSLAANKGAPPPPLTAKPNTYKPKATPARPENPTPESSKLSSKPSLKTPDTEPEEISFEAPITHKPLVGPNAERVRRQNIRLPKKIAELNNNIEEKTTPTENLKIAPLKDKSPDFFSLDSNATKILTPSSKSVTLKAQSLDNNIQDSKLATSTNKTAALKERFSDSTPTDSNPKPISVRERTKDIQEADQGQRNKSTPEQAKDTSPVGGNREGSETKLNYRPKSQMFSSSFQRDNEPSKLLKSDDQDALKKKILALESKINRIEEDNLLLKQETTELTKTNADDIASLTNTVNKLLTEFQEEKKKREAAENEIAELRQAVEDMDMS